MANKKPLLVVENLVAGYTIEPVLKGVSIEVDEGEIVGLIGLNGSGKSTLLKTVFGLVRAREGRIIFNGKEIQNRSPLANLRDGIVYSPQGNRVFVELTVQENLHAAFSMARARWGPPPSNHLPQINSTGRIYDLFPLLRERSSSLAATLSGGEKQQLALARALMLHPLLLLIDEPSLGLAATSTKFSLSALVEMSKTDNTCIFLVEQKVKDLCSIAQHVYALRGGLMVPERSPLTSLESWIQGIFQDS